MRISDWSSDVCSSDLSQTGLPTQGTRSTASPSRCFDFMVWLVPLATCCCCSLTERIPSKTVKRSEEHTSELQSLMRISYAVFCLKKKTQTRTQRTEAENDRATEKTSKNEHKGQTKK